MCGAKLKKNVTFDVSRDHREEDTPQHSSVNRVPYWPGPNFWRTLTSGNGRPVCCCHTFLPRNDYFIMPSHGSWCANPSFFTRSEVCRCLSYKSLPKLGTNEEWGKKLELFDCQVGSVELYTDSSRICSRIASHNGKWKYKYFIF